MGEKPMHRESKKDWEEVKSLLKKGQIEDIPADIYVRYYSSCKAIVKDNLVM